ncbi:MAG: hypothetical protein QUU85_16725 [Candidatus Eisenbacteria bacterium]|nr:hypothetical protein [Candidatus Eisenbacteria bacterium]
MIETAIGPVQMLLTGCLAAAILPAVGLGVVIDFESFYAMDYLSGYPIPEAARLSDQLASAYALSSRRAPPAWPSFTASRTAPRAAPT